MDLGRIRLTHQDKELLRIHGMRVGRKLVLAKYVLLGKKEELDAKRMYTQGFDLSPADIRALDNELYPKD